MADDIFGRCDYGDINAMFQRRKESRGRPCVVEQGDNAGGLRRPADRRDVLNLEGQASRAFHQDCPGIWTEKSCDVRTDQRIIIARAYPHAFEENIGKTAAGVIAAVGKKDLVTRL